MKKLVACFILPNHEDVLTKVRNQGEEVTQLALLVQKLQLS